MDNEITYIDKTNLWDLLEFQRASFEVIDGYFLNAGRNEIINHVIEDLYDSKLKLKKGENPAQVVIKLLMSSMYGETIIKPIETYTVIKDSQHDFGKYVSLVYNYIDSVLEVNGRYYIKKVKSVMSHSLCACRS